MNLAALDRRLPAKGRADHLRQCLRAVDNEQSADRGIKPAFEQIVDESLHHSGILGGAFGRGRAPCALMRAALDKTTNWKKLLRRLGSRLARLCKTLGLRRLCLYSLRGTAAARLKDEGMAARTIAANTAFRHYPSARHAKGWRSRMAISPHPRSVAQVRDNHQPLDAKLARSAASPRLS